MPENFERLCITLRRRRLFPPYVDYGAFLVRNRRHYYPCTSPVMTRRAPYCTATATVAGAQIQMRTPVKLMDRVKCKVNWALCAVKSTQSGGGRVCCLAAPLFRVLMRAMSQCVSAASAATAASAASAALTAAMRPNRKPLFAQHLTGVSRSLGSLLRFRGPSLGGLLSTNSSSRSFSAAATFASRDESLTP